MIIERENLTYYLNHFLKSESFKDYGPNGLQVEGKSQISLVIYGVTASLQLIEAAVNAKADAIIVHHGLFWRGQDGRVTGWMKKRLQQLMLHDINLYAYHLPLDAHPEVGNNAMLSATLGLSVHEYIGEQSIVALAQASSPISLSELARRLQILLGRETIVVPGDGRMIKTVGICTGGGQSYFELAINAGVDAFITGEISEPQAHLARETGVAFLAGGHHATERLGIQALAKNVKETLGVSGQYIEVTNPA